MPEVVKQIAIEVSLTGEDQVIAGIQRINEAKRKGQEEARKAALESKAATTAEKQRLKEVSDAVKARFAHERQFRKEEAEAIKRTNAALKQQKGLVEQIFSGLRGQMATFLIIQAVLSKLGQAISFVKSKVDAGITASGSQDVSIAQLNAALANQGEYSARAAAGLDKYNSVLQRTLGLDDNTTRAIETQILALTDLPEKYLPDATKAVIEISKATGKDYPAAALQFSKALEGNTQGLEKFGVHVKKGATQTEILYEVLDKMSVGWDMAQAAADTYTGKQVILNQAFDEMEERIGAMVTHNPAAVAAMDALGKAVWGIVDSIDAFMQAHPEAMADVMKEIGFSMLKAAGAVESFSYAIGYSLLSMQMMAGDARKNDAATRTNFYTGILSRMSPDDLSWDDVKAHQNQAYKEYQNASKSGQDADSMYKALIEGHADFQQNIRMGEDAISGLSGQDFKWNPKVWGSKGGQPTFKEQQEKKGKAAGKTKTFSDYYFEQLAKYRTQQGGGYGTVSIANSQDDYWDAYRKETDFRNNRIPWSAAGGIHGLSMPSITDAGMASTFGSMLSPAERTKQMEQQETLRHQYEKALSDKQQAKGDRIIGYGNMLLSGNFSGMASQYGMEQGTRLGANWASHAFGGSGLAGTVGGALGGEAGSLLMAGVFRTLKGIGKHLFGGHRERGETPSFPLYTRDVDTGNYLAEMVNLTKSQLVRGGAGGIDSLAGQLRAQQFALGVAKTT